MPGTTEAAYRGPVAEGQLDGRTARRDRNRGAVLDAVLDLFSEGNLHPRPEQVSERSGVALRSVYRYYADKELLRQAAIERNLGRLTEHAVVDEIGEGSLEARIDRFVEVRMHLYEIAIPTSRAARLVSWEGELSRSEVDEVDLARDRLRRQFEAHFAAELARCAPSTAVVLDLATQLEGIEFLRVNRGFTAGEVESHLRAALSELLGAEGQPERSVR